MRYRRTVALLAVLAGLSSAAVGQQAPAPAQTPPAQQPAPSGSQTPPAQPAPSATPPAATPPAAERGPVNDEEFIPSEELSADEEVTFPVGI